MSQSCFSWYANRRAVLACEIYNRESQSCFSWYANRSGNDLGGKLPTTVAVLL